MSAQIGLLWQSILATGRPVFPYVGLVLFIVLVVLVVVLIAYLSYRLLRRFPIFSRHLAWRVVTFLRRLYGWLRRRRSAASGMVLAAFSDNVGHCVPLQDLFLGTTKRRPWSTVVGRRPVDPLYVVIGPSQAGKSALISMVAHNDVRDRPEASSLDGPVPDVIWWRLSHGWVLEVNADFSADYDSSKFKSMLNILQKMCPERPIDAVIVVLPADQIVNEAPGERLARATAGAAVRIGAELGHAVPVHLVVSRSDTLRGFDKLVKLRLALGGGEASLDVRFPSSVAMPEPQQCVDLLRDSILNKALLAMAEQPEWRTNFNLRDVLSLPGEVERMRTSLQAFIAQLAAAGMADAPKLRGMLLTGFSPIRIGDLVPKAVFAEQALRGWLFVRGAPLMSSRAYQSHLAQKARANVIALGCFFAACLALAIWSSLTWKQINQNVVSTEHLFESLGPELRIARLPYRASVSDTDTASLGKLLSATWLLAETSLTYCLVPSSWTSDIRTAALLSVGEIINRTAVGPRSERLSSDMPRVSDELLAPAMGVAVQRIEDLPAYIALVDFLDKRELLGASMESGERFAKRVSYGEFLRFFGLKPEQVKLHQIDWRASIPALVTERFHVERSKTPEIEAAIRHTVEAYWERVLREAFDFHPVILQSNDVVEGARGIVGAGSFGMSEAQQLGSALKSLRREVELPSARRVLGNKSEALSFFTKAQLRLGVSSVVSTGQVVELAAVAEKRFDLLRTRLAREEIDGVGLLFTSDAREGTLALSSDSKRFAAAYATFLGQSFMRSIGRRADISMRGDQYIEWALPELGRVRGLSDAFHEYSAGVGQSFDARIKGGLLRLARTNYLALAESVFFEAARVHDVGVARAEPGMEGENSDLRRLSARVANLAAASKFYRLVQPQANALAEPGPVAELLHRETILLLDQIESNLYQEDPYMSLMSGVSNWVRNAPPGKVLGSDFRGNAKERLALLREYVRMQYAELVLPLLDAMSNMKQKGTPDIVVRWMRLRDTIDGYEKGNTNNGAYEFERYILALTKLRDADECRSFVDERQLPVRRSDYFSRKLALLDESVVRACDQRIVDWQRRQYQTFAGWFNGAASGRAPFYSGNFRAGTPSLSPQTFMQVLAQYEEYRARSMRGGNDKTPWPDDVTRFLARMNQLSAHFMPAQNGAIPVASAAITGVKKPVGRNEQARADAVVRARIGFRTNRADEMGADQIIEWHFTSAERRYTANSKEPFEWRVGDSIEVGFRWAANSPVSPLAATSTPTNFTASERTATFKYTGDWALFELLGKHGSKNTAGVDGTTLLFTVPTIGPEGRRNAKVFATLMPLDDGMTLMSVFPTEAPSLPSDWGSSP